MSNDTLEFSERVAREMLNALQAEFGSLHRLRAAHKLLLAAEAMLELSERDDNWISLGEAAARVVSKLEPNNE
jgi:hypothetical protein